MGISMIGIDHNMAPVDIRALFAFTKKSAGEAMEKNKKLQRNLRMCDPVYMQPSGSMGQCGQRRRSVSL